MSFFIPTQELNYLINKVQNVVPAKSAQPILSHVLLEVEEGILTLTATDLTVGISCSTEVKMLKRGSVTLPARRLAQLVRELTAPNLQITLLDHFMVEILANTSKFRLHGMNSSDYTRLPQIADAERFRIPQATLKDLLHKVSFAIAREESRFVLTGALMRIAGGRLTLLGTDGKRLARIHAAVEADPSLSGSYVLPLKAIEELLKNLTEEGNADVFLMQDKIAFAAGSTILMTKLLTGEYPDVSRVIPESSEIVMTLHREELTSLLKQMALFTAENNHSVKFTFTNGDLTLSATTSEIGEGRVNMPVNYQGPQLNVAFNPAFFLDILRHSKKETVSIGLTDSYNPGVITESEDELAASLAANPLFILMPMRLNEESPC